MSLSKGDARNTACYSAEINGAETSKEAVLPRLRCGGGFGVDVFLGTGKDIVETVLPLVQIIVVDGTVIGSLGRH